MLTRPGCHLCEQMERTLEVVLPRHGLSYEAVNEVLLDVPTTAHILGGACVGETPEHGVIDPYHRVYGHEGLHVADGAAIGANLGVNPSLTITAMAERAMALWPNRGEDDPRPSPGQPYRAVAPTAPRSPAVPPAVLGVDVWDRGDL